MNASVLSIEVQDNLKHLVNFLKLLACQDNPKVIFDLEHAYEVAYDGQEVVSTSIDVVTCFALMKGYKTSSYGVHFSNGLNVEWSMVAERFMGIGSEHRTKDILDWINSGEWSDVDNTAIGAAARINYFLKYGLPSAFLVSNSCAKYNETMVVLYAGEREAITPHYVWHYIHTKSA